MNTYIDLGCYDGDTVEQFMNWKNLAYPEDFKIYAFDPNPRFRDKWNKIENENTKFEQKAAWIEDGEIEYTLRPKDAPLGSTVMKEKRDWGQGEILKVQCFDFSNWLKQFKDDFVIVKMDTEGAELPILTKMIKDNTDKIVTKLFVEWHDSKMPTYNSNKDWIQKNLKCNWSDWR